MDFSLTDEQSHLQKEIIRFAQEELNDGVEERDLHQEFPHELWKKCGAMGLQGLPVPEHYGGSGLDPLSTALALEALGYGCHDGGLTFAICAHLLACVVPIWKHGSEEQRRRYLPELCNGERIAVNAMTEPGSGSDAFAMQSRALPDGDGYRINGTKVFSSNGHVADLAVVYALSAPEKGSFGGVSVFLVERGTPGFHVGQKYDKIGLRSCPLSELVFEDVFVPKEALLGRLGAGTAMFSQSMEWERICLVACHIGTMQRLLETAVEQAKTRVAFGQPIGKFQSISHRIADMKTRLEAARLLTYSAAWRMDRARTCALEASMAKLFTSEALVRTALDTVQTLGGYGCMTEYGVERALRDAIASTIYSGTSEMQRNIIAGWLGL